MYVHCTRWLSLCIQVKLLTNDNIPTLHWHLVLSFSCFPSSPKMTLLPEEFRHGTDVAVGILLGIGILTSVVPFTYIVLKVNVESTNEGHLLRNGSSQWVSVFGTNNITLHLEVPFCKRLLYFYRFNACKSIC